MPELTPQTLSDMRLYQRCDAFQTLPRAGGIWDQLEEDMQVLDAVRDEIRAWESERAKAEEAEREKQRLFGKLNG